MSFLSFTVCCCNGAERTSCCAKPTRNNPVHNLPYIFGPKSVVLVIETFGKASAPNQVGCHSSSAADRLAAAAQTESENGIATHGGKLPLLNEYAKADLVHIHAGVRCCIAVHSLMPRCRRIRTSIIIAHGLPKAVAVVDLRLVPIRD